MIDLAGAEARLRGQARHTPLLASPFLDEMAGRRVLIKPECLQHTGSFKFRGATNAIAQLPEGTRGVLAYSSGNHAQGVALAAARRGLPAVIVMPDDAPALKLANTRALGAEVVCYRRGAESREEIGAALAADRGLALVAPFDDARVIAGQATVGLEIARDARALGIKEAEVLVPCGGGGLSAGVALALAREAPRMRLRTVEPEGFDDAARSLATGERCANPAETGSICDAIVTPAPGALTLPILAAHAGPGLTVTDTEALRAMAQAFVRLKLVAEPGGAVALAAALWRAEALEAETVIAVISGGNTDAALFARALKEI